MIAIIKVDSADFINRLDTEKFNLRMIPSTRIKFDSEDVKFYEPIFYNDVEVIDEPPEPDTDTCIFKSQLPEYFWDYIQECISTGNFPTEEQLDPNNYYLKSSLPTFLNKFVAMALTKPAGIIADTYEKTCQLLQTADARISGNINQIFNWAGVNSSNMNVELSKGMRISQAQQAYLIQETTIISDKKFNLRTHQLTIEAVFYLMTYANDTNILAAYVPVENNLASNHYLQIIKSNYKNFVLAGRTSTVSGNTFSENVDLSFSGGDAQSISYNPITLSATVKPSADQTTFFSNLTVEYYANKNQQNYKRESTSYGGAIKALPSSDVQERIGYLRRNRPTTAGQNTYYGVGYLRKYISKIKNISTNQEETLTYIDYDKSKVIDEALLTIV